MDCGARDRHLIGWCTKVSKIIYTYRMREISTRAVKGAMQEGLWLVESSRLIKGYARNAVS